MVGLATTPATQVLEDDEIATEKEKEIEGEDLEETSITQSLEDDDEEKDANVEENKRRERKSKFRNGEKVMHMGVV
uniref:Uncharacterized protein n=1 Tax=Cucumis sativus TaxID=3659 RepID=A0A0A0M0Q0_CUCSA